MQYKQLLKEVRNKFPNKKFRAAQKLASRLKKIADKTGYNFAVSLAVYIDIEKKAVKLQEIARRNELPISFSEAYDRVVKEEEEKPKKVKKTRKRVKKVSYMTSVTLYKIDPIDEAYATTDIEMRQAAPLGSHRNFYEEDKRAENSREVLLNKAFKNKFGKDRKSVTLVGVRYVQMMRTVQLVVTNPDIYDFAGMMEPKFLQGKKKRVRNPDYERLMTILETDKNFGEGKGKKNEYAHVKPYTGMIEVGNLIVETKNSEQMVKIRRLNIKDIEMYENADLDWGLDDNLTNNHNIKYDLNPEAQTFNQLFAKKEAIDYVKENKKLNSCFLNLIIDTFKPTFDKLHKRKIITQELTYEYLLGLLGRDGETQDIGLSLEGAKIFFETYRIGLVCTDAMDKVIFEYRPEKMRKDISPSILYIQFRNYHCYRLNKIDNLSKTYELADEKMNELAVKNRTFIKTKNEETEIHMINFLNDITKIMVKQDVTKEKSISFIYCGISFDDLLCDMVHQEKYSPTINHTKSLNSIQFTIGEIKCMIKTNDISSGDNTMCQIYDIDEYKNYLDIDYKFYDAIMNKKHLSNFNANTISIIDEYLISPISCSFNKSFEGEYHAVDMNKAYTYNLTQMKYVPVYNIFDVWRKYENQEIEDYTQYLVKCDDKSIASMILFNKTYTRVYGLVLKQINVNYIILYYWKPSTLIPFRGDLLVEDLYQQNLSIDIKKSIANVNLGKAEKKYNSKSVSKIFKSLDEATFYCVKYGIENEPKLIGNDIATAVYVLNIEKECRLRDGFTPIKDFIYSYQRLRLYQLYNILNQKKIKMFGIKTDCILVESSKGTLRDEGIVFDTDIGGYKFEQTVQLIGKCIERKKNDLIDFKSYTPKILKIKDEFDADQMKTLLQKNNKVAVLGTFPGVGKTTAVKNSFENILFVSPYNKLCQQLQKDGKKAITLHMLLGLGINGERTQTHGKYKPVDRIGKDTTVICFDEILLYEPALLQRIYYFMQDHKYKYVCTGDLNQLDPITQQKFTSEYMEDCLSILFPKRLVLEISKRLKNKEDRDKLASLKKAIFDTNNDIVDIINQFGFNTITNKKDIKTTRNITYFNYRRKQINNHVHDKLITAPKETIWFGPYKLWKGFELLCLNYSKIDYQTKVQRNFSYILDQVNMKEKWFTVIEPVENITIKIPYNDDNIALFALPYASTCHSFQGMSIDVPMTIFDANTAYASRKFIWTALTRATDFNNITFFIHDNEETERLWMSKIDQYLKLTIEAYNIDDKMNSKKYDKGEYISIDWFRQQLKANPQFDFTIEDTVVVPNFKITKVNDRKAYTKENCRLSKSE